MERIARRHARPYQAAVGNLVAREVELAEQSSKMDALAAKWRKRQQQADPPFRLEAAAPPRLRATRLRTQRSQPQPQPQPLLRANERARPRGPAEAAAHRRSQSTRVSQEPPTCRA